MGTVIASDTALALSTTRTANLVQNTYDYIGPGFLTLYSKASLATVLCDLFVQGNQVIRNQKIPFTGTAGTMDVSANKVTTVKTMGGRVELTFVATTGTPTVDYLLIHEGVIGGALSKLFGR